MATTLQSVARESPWTRACRLAERATSLIVAFVLLTAGVSHLANPYYLLTRAIDYPLIGPHSALAIAIILPSLELVLGICLVFRIMPLSAHMLAALLMTTFVAAQFAALASGLQIDCGCFGPASAEPISARTIARTAALDAAVIVSCVCEYLACRATKTSGPTAVQLAAQAS